MIDIYPVARTGWLDLFAHLFNFNRNLEHENTSAHLEAVAFRLFRQFLALKIAAPFAFSDGIYWPFNISNIIILLVVLLVGSSRYYLMALLVILGFSSYDIWYSWPFTINHQVLEFVIILLMCLIPEEKPKTTRFSCIHMIQILMLSVWFFSGAHRLFDGYYWNAEFFALEALSGDTTLGYLLSKILGLASLFSASCCTHGMIEITTGQAGMLLALAWMTIVVEIFLPISLLLPKFRSCGIIGLFIFQGMVTYFSGEIDFAFSAFAILLLFVPRTAPWTYPALAFLFLMVKPWT